MTIDLYKVAIFFYMVIAIQVQPEFKHDHNHEHHHHKHPHDHDHDHHLRSQIRKASRIYNGVRTAPGHAKFMAVMVKTRRRNHCSAVIITGDMLLTAAHCLYNKSYNVRSKVKILPNALPISTYRNNRHSRHPLIRRIMNFWIHPRYKPNSTDKIFDIAIVQIGPQPWPLGYGIDTALMPVRTRHLDLRVIKGYGYGREVGEISPAYLNEMKFRYYGTESLFRRFFQFQISNDDLNAIFCVTNWSPYQSHVRRIHSNIGPGDSGGGIFIKGSVRRLDIATNRTIIKTGMVLAGIAAKADNYSISSADSDLPYGAVAVNVTTMMSWINSIVRVDFETYPYPVLGIRIH